MKLRLISPAILMAFVITCSSLQAEALPRCSVALAQFFRNPIVQNTPVLRSLPQARRARTEMRRELPPEDAYRFGLEFTVTTQEIVNEGNRNPKDFSLSNNPIKAEALRRFWDLLKEKCGRHPGCASTMSSDKHGDALKLQFADGFYFTVGNDSAVIEINAKPQTINGFERVKGYLDDFVFKIAEQVGLRPHSRAGQGHIHISRDALLDDPVLLRNFFVDFQNRPEIIYGALGNHLLNSPPLSAQKAHQRQALHDLLAEFDARHYTIDEFIDAVEGRVYTSSHAGDWGSYDYYQAFNMTRLKKSEASATIEIRSFRPQRSVQEFELQTRLISRWIEHLRDRPAPVEYNMSDRYEFTAQETVDGYYRLIQELSLPWNEYRALLPDNLIQIQPTGLR